MTFFVGNMAEKEIKSAFSENQQTDLSIELLNYQRHFFTANAISKVKVTIDPQTTITLNITSTIFHFPYQALIKSNIEIADEISAKKAERYFGSPNWLTSEEKIDLFSQLTGLLTVASGKYVSESESLMTESLLFTYQIDLKNKSADMQLYWAGLKGVTYGTVIKFNSLQLNARIGESIKKNDYDYKLALEKISVEQHGYHSLLEGLVLKGSSQQGKTEHTIDTSNELILDSYQLTNDTQQTFVNNHIKFAFTGLYQPAFELLNSGGAEDSQEVEEALIELLYNGAQLTLSKLTSQTPWGEVDGTFDLILDQGVPLIGIIDNPYILLDYISGDANLILPLNLLDEPRLTDFLQIGVMSGFLLQKEQTLNLETSFQRGELIVNGRVIPL
jgi:uncharacterized protein YdgA (DUF945 family)